VQLKWNRGSTGLLAVAQSDVDKTNQSYYGESKLNYLTTNGSHEGLVPLRMFGISFSVFWLSADTVTFDCLIHEQVKKGQFTMFSGHVLVQNLLLFMDVSLFHT
jgi:hypothetical protein